MSSTNLPTNLQYMLTSLLGAEHANQLSGLLQIPASTLRPRADTVSRIEIAQALNMLLFEKLLKAVPQGNDYVQDSVRAGNKIRFDHGALRTVLGISTGNLPAGEAAFTRILRPLGYQVNGIYPLQRISMTGRAYAHEDDAEEIAQFFLSELHPHHFSSEFQATVNKVLSTSQDPVDAHSAQLLQQLGNDKALPLADALALLPVLVATLVILTNHDYSRWFLATEKGHYMLAYAVLSQIAGAVCMRMIIRTRY